MSLNWRFTGTPAKGVDKISKVCKEYHMTKFIYSTVVVLLLSLGLFQGVSGIGQLTSPIRIQDVLRGQEITEVLILLNSEEKEVAYKLEAEGEIEGWTSFYKIEDKNFENPINEIQLPTKSRVDVAVKFAVPEDVPNGKYTGQAVVVSIPEKDTETGKMLASVFQKVGREVSIIVTDKEVIKLKTVFIPLYDVEEGEPLTIRTIYNNQGNVLVKPDVQVRISKDGKTVFNAVFPYPEGEEAVKPRMKKEILLSWQTAGQKAGGYRAELKVLLGGEVIEEKDFPFNIGFINTDLKGAGLLGILGINEGNLTVVWLVIGGLLLALSVIFGLVNKLKTRTKDND